RPRRGAGKTTTLRTLPPLPKPTNQRHIVLRMDEDGRPNPAAYIDDKTFDPKRIDQTITHGTTETWTVTNANQNAPHNFHMHLIQFRILERDGKPTPPTENGLKDTVRLLPGETVTLQATFNTYKGRYPYHCHLLDHSAMGMMAQMQIT
ncbi:bilirubin oxidase, partial [Streptomyces sp. NRRL B-1568]